jgi:glycosyltransferase involved in cell wall biosynthesis
MRICLIHNEYGKISGEEIVVKQIIGLLRANGHDVTYFHRSSAEIPDMRFGNVRAFFSGIYSFSSKYALRRFLEEQRPDIVHVHNVFPLISPSVLVECRQQKVPVVMTLHNYRLVCPSGLFLLKGHICERCAGGKEYHCIWNNCEANLFKSAGYAIRNWVAHTRRFFLDNVTLFASLTQFQRNRLIEEGFPGDRIEVLPNMVEDHTPNQVVLGDYVGYSGRISPEKGIPTLLQAALNCPQISFEAAGSYDRMPDLPGRAPQNFRFLGHLNKNRLKSFYKSSRLVVLPTICYEAFPLVVIEAMMHAKPVVCSRIGGLPEIVEDGVTGLLFEPGNAEDLGEKIRYLWERPELAIKMGKAGRDKALREYSLARYYERLMQVYYRALELHGILASHT